MNEGDIDALMAGLNQWEVARVLTNVPFPYALEDAEAWIASLRPAEPGRSNFGIEVPGHGMVGAVGTGKELGYWLDRRFHGRGYMTEACMAVLDWHFSELPDDIVHSGAHVGNQASLNVQRKLGFIHTGQTTERFVRSQNRTIAHVETTLTRSDYEAARAQLPARNSSNDGTRQ